MILVAPDHIESGTGRLIQRQTAAQQGAISGKYRFAPGDIIYSKIRPYLRKAILADFEGLCSADMYPLTPAPGVSAEYMLAMLLGHDFSEFAVAASARSGISKVNREELAQYVVTLPPDWEQCAVGKALHDVDAMTAAMEQLIAKKRDVKQAAMQRLLTGEQRSPEFTRAWRRVALRQLGEFTKGKGIRRDEVTDPVSRIPRSVARTSQRLRPGDVLFAASGETAEEIGKAVAYVGDGEAYAGGDIVIPTPNGQDSSFLGYLLNHSSVAAQRARMGQGDAVVHIGARQLGALELTIPEPDEQRAIAAVLADMDAELAVLEQRLTKTRALKRAMMQELLTGRTRLAPADAG